jgi:AcrR family transcriptional regulator
MRPSRRTDAPDGDTRRALLDATAQIMLEEGYAAATSRRIAARAGVKPPLLHYYFPTMDQLYLAVVRRGAEANLERLRRALAADQPLHALWNLTSEPRQAQLNLEFMALANHRKEIRAELVAAAERYRDMQVAGLIVIMRRHDLGTDTVTPEAMSVVISCLGHMTAIEDVIGITGGHTAMRVLVDHCLSRFELPVPVPGQRGDAAGGRTAVD